jgi:hypothetical protein
MLTRHVWRENMALHMIVVTAISSKPVKALPVYQKPEIVKMIEAINNELTELVGFIVLVVFSKLAIALTWFVSALWVTRCAFIRPSYVC